MLIQWNHEYSVHVGEIDTQHRQLVGMVNDLFTAMQYGKGREVAGRIIDGLIVYSKTHFATEEKYFDLFGYSEAQQHKAEHADFVTKVSKFHDDYQKGRVGLSIGLLNFLSDWLRQHIKISDKRYGPVFNDHGLY